MLPQVAYKGCTLHWVYQVIIETFWMWTMVCSVFGENHVPCTLKTESETKSSPGFSIDIISDILSEWMLPFFSKWANFTAISYDGSNLHFYYLQTYIVDLHSANPLKRLACRHAACRHAATLEHIILTLSQTLKNIHTPFFAEKQSLVWRNRHSDPWSTALDTVTIVPHFTTDEVQPYWTLHPTANCFSNGNVYILIFWKKLDSRMILAILFKPFGFIAP